MIYEYKLQMDDNMDVMRWLVEQPFIIREDYSTAYKHPKQLTIWFESEVLKESLLQCWGDRVLAFESRY